MHQTGQDTDSSEDCSLPPRPGSIVEGTGREELSATEPDTGEPPEILAHPVTGLPEDRQWRRKETPPQGEHR